MWSSATGLTYNLRVELGQTRLAVVVEHEHGVDHGVGRAWRAARTATGRGEGIVQLVVLSVGAADTPSDNLLIRADAGTSTRYQNDQNFALRSHFP